MENRVKNKQMKIRVDDNEYNIIKAKAKKADLNVNQYLRKLALNGHIYKQDIKSINSLINEINKIGVNINQIARYVNSTSEVNKVQILSLQGQVESIWLLLRSSLLKQDYQRL